MKNAQIGNFLANFSQYEINADPFLKYGQDTYVLPFVKPDQVPNFTAHIPPKKKR